MSLFTASAVAILAAVVAWRAGTLTPGGAVSAALIGASILAGVGWPGGAVLAAFFVSSNLVSRLLPLPKLDISDAKGDQRDSWQVWANGGPAAVAALTGFHDHSLGLWLVTCSLAAAGADTWATVCGRRSPTPPRDLLRGLPVPPGTSGGVTVAGSMGSLIGAALVAGTGAVAGRAGLLFPAGVLIGFLGMLADSLLGAAFQGRFHCLACAQPSERTLHRCGAPTTLCGGFPWLTNDGVNAVATALGAAGGWAGWVWLAR